MESLFDLTCFNSESEQVFGKEGFQAAFRNEVMSTSVNYTYSGTLQIMGLASVVGIPIETLYPEQNNKVLPVYQAIFNPRKANINSTQTLQIMWTNTGGWPDRSKEFKVNHFVPLFKISSDRKPCDDWTYVGNKGKGTSNKWVEDKKMRQRIDNEHKTKSKQKTFRNRGTKESKAGKYKPQKVKAHSKGQKTSSAPSETSYKTAENMEQESSEQSEPACDETTRNMEQESSEQSEPACNETMRNMEQESNEQREPACGETTQNMEQESSEQREPACDETTQNLEQESSEQSEPACDETTRNMEQESSEQSEPACDETMRNMEQESSEQREPACDETTQNLEQESSEQSEPACDETTRNMEQESSEQREPGCDETTQNLEQESSTQNDIAFDKTAENMEQDSSDTSETAFDESTQNMEQESTEQNETADDETAQTFSKYMEERSALPFPCASRRFYANENFKATKNNRRAARRAKFPILQGSDKKQLGVQRSKVNGSLKENIDSIQKELLICINETKKAELMAFYGRCR